jgi:transcriptional regulator with XRE-family HTH domain
MTRVKAERIRRGWTQVQLAYRVGIHTSDISRIENGHLRPLPKHRQALARVLGLDHATLLDEVA